MPRPKATVSVSPAPGPAAGRIFKWRSGGGFKVPAQVVGEELEKLEVRPGDHHRAPDVLDAARNPDSPLHQCFDWDDEKAAEAHRLNTCRGLLRSISFVVVRGEKRVKQPVYVHVTDAEGPRYVRSEKLATDSEIRKSALDEALALLAGVRRRFEFLEELAPVFRAIDEAAGASGSRHPSP